MERGTQVKTQKILYVLSSFYFLFHVLGKPFGVWSLEFEIKNKQLLQFFTPPILKYSP